jgi:hypothetical protein
VLARFWSACLCRTRSVESELLACRVREDELHKQVDASRSALLTAEISLSRSRAMNSSQPMFNHLSSSVYMIIANFLEVSTLCCCAVRSPACYSLSWLCLLQSRELYMWSCCCHSLSSRITNLLKRQMQAGRCCGCAVDSLSLSLPLSCHGLLVRCFYVLLLLRVCPLLFCLQPPEESHRARSLRNSVNMSSISLLSSTPALAAFASRSSALDTKTIAQLEKGSKEQRAVVQRLRSLEVSHHHACRAIVCVIIVVALRW